MVAKLDLKDRKILYELDVNSRQPNSAIAKKVGLSKQVVGFRIKRLLKEQIISSFHTVIDISKLGFTVHKNFLRLQNLDKGKERELLEFLVQHPEVVWVASCDGEFDLAFGTWARDVAQLDKTLQTLYARFGDCIAEREIATIIRGEYFIRDYLVERKIPSDEREAFFGSVPAPAEMDKRDWEILLRLARDARSTAVEIAAEITLSADAVAERIRKLERSEVIRHYHFVPNESIYPYLHYKVLVRFRNTSEARMRTLREYCRTNTHIVYIVNSLGPWEFEIDLEVSSIAQFRELLMELKTQFSDILKDYSVLNVYQVHKYNFCPSIPNTVKHK